MRKRYARRLRKPAELMLVPMIDIFTVLVTFLLMTAVFSRITIVELDLPSSAAAAVTEPMFRLEVIVREQGFELTNGHTLIAAIPKLKGEYDVKTLTQLAVSLKRDYPDADDASVLLEPGIPYDHLIQVMDAIRSAEVPAPAEAPAQDPEARGPQLDVAKVGAPPTRIPLFTNISVGDAP